ncbi:transcriptional regulator, ArsR family [Paenibacillaceae bacterium GAS479]|nr:transcriptional regulator, ArsR family [Paenibacillaceae bacterium GAS479]
MNIYSTSSKKSETYKVEIKGSPLWECALGIAAITNTSLLDSLERPLSYWNELKQSLSENLLLELEFVEKNNTWKALLQLLHESDFSSIGEFKDFIKHLSPKQLKYICIPFTGHDNQKLREKASQWDEEAILQLIELSQENAFFPAYIQFICHADSALLKQHLTDLIEAWFIEVIEPEIELINTILKTDISNKQSLQEKMHPEEFVEWATSGINYVPEPSVFKVLLIPHYIYRPWNLTADIEGCKVFYYPVSNESLSPSDKLMPSNFLVLKYKALGDEVRLKIIKILSGNNASLQEITDRLELGKSTIHHHLKILRSAQLVRIQDSKYALNSGAVKALTTDLELYLENK